MAKDIVLRDGRRNGDGWREAQRRSANLVRRVDGSDREVVREVRGDAGEGADVAHGAGDEGGAVPFGLGGRLLDGWLFAFLLIVRITFLLAIGVIVRQMESAIEMRIDRRG